MKRFWIAALLLCVGCSNANPLAPAAIPATSAPDFSGLWTVPYALTYCNAARLTNLCRTSSPHFTIDARQVGRDVFAIVTVGGVLVEVRGTVADDGRLFLSGRKEQVSIHRPFAEIRDLTLAIDPQAGLAGSLHFVIDYSGTRFDTLRFNEVRGNVTGASRIPAEKVGELSGTWSGYYLMLACNRCPDGVGWVDSINMQLHQVGPDVSGTVQFSPYGSIPVTGTRTGNVLTLQGFQAAMNLSGVSSTSVTITVDPFRRLSGRALFTTGSQPSALVSTHEIELIDLLLDRTR